MSEDASAVQDLTRRMAEAEEALRESQARYRRLLSRMPALVFELAPDGTLLFVNEALAPLTGYQPDEVQGRNWWRSGPRSRPWSLANRRR